MSKTLEISIHNFDVLDSIRYRIELLTILGEMCSDYFLRNKITAEQLEVFYNALNGDTQTCVSDLKTLLSCIQNNVDMEI